MACSIGKVTSCSTSVGGSPGASVPSSSRCWGSAEGDGTKRDSTRLVVGQGHFLQHLCYSVADGGIVDGGTGARALAVRQKCEVK